MNIPAYIIGSDKKTANLAAYWVARYDAAVAAGDDAELAIALAAINGSPNRPFRAEIAALMQVEA